MGPVVATLLGRALIKKVGENDGRVAKNEMLESFGSDSGNHFPGKVSVFDGRVAKKRRPDSGPTCPTGSDWLRQTGAGSAARDLPSTRAGGQDDVSLNKLPQTIVRYDYYSMPRL